MSKKAVLVVHTTYTIHPEDKQIFTNAVLSHISATRKTEGNVYYHFSWDMVDPNTCVLAEGWVNQKAIDDHLKSEMFQAALKAVIEHVRILERHGTLYTVSGETDIIPETTN
ncbi:antibiotic biosynthesis monooxygenase [Mucilaginibacter gossypii]|uniref:putative quinol monooxygenase n=1 Tax=Mucilaginibacter gossypii TaxID=551996 RepID=UPI000DCD2827|nr:MULTISPECIES: antibiotic biosynthesis monooxygenase [Mucilaginibacter]QTE38551.1 antibiotic biosynthesis monooxygenase [Mucilaginibacter gossypii]RAV52829.1 antibiotic biosynthesis monooxygenase [Mucilaginibacter rubeus]